MNRRLYRLIRDLHLYLGLFISPFVIAFSISVFFLVHAWMPKTPARAAPTRLVSNVPLPANLSTLSGRALIDAIKPALVAADVYGEVGFVRHMAKENRLIIPVTIPGREITVSLSLEKREASVESRETGLADALIFLHKSPGQHLADIRMNWFYMRIWRWLADATVYLTLFSLVSGLYLWYALRAERKVGISLLVAGAISFFGIAYVLCH